jgi:hypothetical protein
MPDENETLTYELRRPLRSGQPGEVKTVTIREPSVRDLKRAASKSKDQTEQGLFLLQIISDLTPDDFDSLKLKDLEGLGAVAKDFLPSSVSLTPEA